MRICLLILFCLCARAIRANHTDSLKKRLQNTSESNQLPTLLDLAWDENLSLEERKAFALQALNISEKKQAEKDRLEILKALSLIVQRAKSEDAEKYYRETVALAKDLNELKALGTAYNNLGLFFQQLGAYDSALIYYQLAVGLFDKENLFLNSAQNQVNIGIIYKNIGLYHEAVQSCLTAIVTLEKEHDTASIVSAYNNIGICLKELKEYSKAEFYLLRGLSFQKEATQTEKRGIAVMLNNLGNVYRNWNKIEKALIAYTQSLQIKQELGDSILIATTIDNIAEVYLTLKKYSSADTLYKYALRLRLTKNYTPGIITSMNRLSKFSIEHSSIDSAEGYATYALELAEKINVSDERLESYRLLKLIHEKKGEFKAALYYADRYNDLYDSLFTEAKTKALANLEIKYRTEQYIKDLTLSRENEKLQQADIRIKTLIIILLVIVLLTISVIIIVLRKNLQIKKKAVIIENTLRKELYHRINNVFGVLSGLFSLQEKHVNNSELKKTLAENQSRLDALIILHQVLNKEGVADTVDMKMYLEKLWENTRAAHEGANPSIQTFFEIEKIELSPKYANRIGLIINEIITNAFKYSFPFTQEPFIKITLQNNTEKVYQFEIIHGSNYWDYETSKLANSGHGLKLMNMLIDEIDGEIIVHNHNIQTTYLVSVPIIN